jgi:hypothetical protein
MRAGQLGGRVCKQPSGPAIRGLRTSNVVDGLEDVAEIAFEAPANELIVNIGELKTLPICTKR